MNFPEEVLYRPPILVTMRVNRIVPVVLPATGFVTVKYYCTPVKRITTLKKVIRGHLIFFLLVQKVKYDQLKFMII